MEKVDVYSLYNSYEPRIATPLVCFTYYVYVKTFVRSLWTNLFL